MAGGRSDSGFFKNSEVSANHYNQHPTWLDLAHKKLDDAVFSGYGWPEGLSDEEILERLLKLNLERPEAGTA